MHAEGASVTLTDIQDDRGQRVAADLGDRARYLHCDVSSEPDVAQAVDEAVREFGRLDCMFNNAGIVGLQGGLGPHVYGAAKGAVVALTKNVAAELGAWSIRVNAIAPGKILPPMNAANLTGAPRAM